MLVKTNEPTVTVKVSDSPLQCLRVQELGSYIACGSKDGSITLIELSQSLSKMQNNERQLTSAVRNS
jgi:dynein intermediate chain 2, axonemal